MAHYREMTPRTEGGSPVPGQLIALVKRGKAGGAAIKSSSEL